VNHTFKMCYCALTTITDHVHGIFSFCSLIIRIVIKGTSVIL